MADEGGRGALAAAVYNTLDRWYHTFREGSIETILTAARERSATLGRPVDVQWDGEGWQGVAVDLDADGALLVRLEGGEIRRVLASEVSIRTPGTHMGSTRT